MASKKLGELSSPLGTDLFRFSISGDTFAAAPTVASSLSDVVISNISINGTSESYKGVTYAANTLCTFRATANVEMEDQCDITIEYTTVTNAARRKIDNMHIEIHSAIDA